MLRTGPRISTFSQFFVFWGMLKKTQKVSIGAKIVLLQNYWDVKDEVFEKKSALVVFALLEKKTERKNNKNENRNIGQ